jgi:hypothetical protein
VGPVLHTDGHNDDRDNRGDNMDQKDQEEKADSMAEDQWLVPGAMQ